jgi:hypothetical protein
MATDGFVYLCRPRDLNDLINCAYSGVRSDDFCSAGPENRHLTGIRAVLPITQSDAPSRQYARC